MLMATSPGVYGIFNNMSSGAYIGSCSRTISGRWSTHRYYLRLGKHDNRHLQNSWNKYGEDAFAFVVLENCLSEDCLDREEWWYQKFKSEGRPLYNIREHVASQLGFKHSANTKAQIAAMQRGRIFSPESRVRMRAAPRRNPTWLDKYRIVKDWTLVSPEGVVHRIHNLTAFCREHGLDVSAMRKVALGIVPSHKGWLAEGADKPRYGRKTFLGPVRTITSPDGTVYENIRNLAEFCREHELHGTSMEMVCRGEQRHHRGWTGVQEGHAQLTVNTRLTRTWPLFLGPDGQVYEVENLFQFCRDHGLDKAAMQRVANGKSHTHLGWRLA